MIEGKHVKKQVCEAVREVARRAREEAGARAFVDEVHEALDAMLEKLCEKRKDDWRNGPVTDSALTKKKAPKKKAPKKAG